MAETGSEPNVVVLRTVFLIGAVLDAVIAVEWFLISLGLVDLPVHPSFFRGGGQDFQYVLSIAALFMTGWAFLLFWGSLRPIERRGLLLLTAVMLSIAILSDGIVFAHLFSTRQIVLGTSVKLSLVVLFSGSYWYSRRLKPRPSPSPRSARARPGRTARLSGRDRPQVGSTEGCRCQTALRQLSGGARCGDPPGAGNQTQRWWMDRFSRRAPPETSRAPRERGRADRDRRGAWRWGGSPPWPSRNPQPAFSPSRVETADPAAPR